MTNERRNFSNTATTTTLTGGMTASSTSLTVASASNYPDPPFTIRVDSEIIRVGGKTGTLFNTLTRGYDDTVAATHSVSAEVAHVAVAADFRNKWINPITVEDTSTAYDDEFEGESTASWSAITPTGNADWTEQYGVLSVLFDSQVANDCAANVTSLNGLSYPLYAVTASRIAGPHDDFLMFGPLFCDGTTSTANVTWNMTHYDDTNPGRLYHSHRSGTITNVSTAHYSSQGVVWGGWIWQRIDWITTNSFRAWLSPDGISWVSLGQTAQAPTLTPTHYGLGVSSWDTTTSTKRAASFEFFRVYTEKPSYWQEG